MKIASWLLALAVAPLCATAQKTPPATSPSAGTASLSYHLDSARASFTLPPTFTARSRSAIDQQLQAKKDAATGDQKAQLQCLTVPFTSLERSSQGLASVSIISYSLPCSHSALEAKDLDEFAAGVVHGMARNARNQFRPAVRYRLDSFDAVLLRGALYDATGRTTQVFLACILAKPDVHCWEVTAPTSPRLAELAALPIRFDDGKQSPLVPVATYATVASPPAIDAVP